MQVAVSPSDREAVRRDGIPVRLVVTISTILRYAPTWHSKLFVARFPPLLIPVLHDSERSATQPRFFNHPDRHGRKRHYRRVLKSHPIQGSDLAQLIGQDFGPYGQRFTAFQTMQTWVPRCIHCSTPLSQYKNVGPGRKTKMFIAAQDSPISNAVSSLRTPTENRFWLRTVISPSCSFASRLIQLIWP